MITELSKLHCKITLLGVMRKRPRILADFNPLIKGRKKIRLAATLALRQNLSRKSLNQMEIRLRNIIQAANKVPGRNVRTSCKLFVKSGSMSQPGMFLPKSTAYMICTTRYWDHVRIQLIFRLF